MRNCPNCGAHFADDEVFCPICGQEVQIVPDFVTAEIQMQEIQKRIAREELARKEAQEREEMIRRRVRQRRNHVILVICLIAAAITAWFVVTRVMAIRREHSTFSYQYEKAEELLKQGDISGADEYLRRALDMNPDDRNALLLQVDILHAQSKDQDAENLLFHYMELYPDDEESYVRLIDAYLEAGRNEDVLAILSDCSQPVVLQRYARLLPAGPVFAPEEGVYNRDQKISLSTDIEGTIYYTTDGSDPTSSSKVYDGSFTVSEGITTIKAMLVTEEGFPSPVTAGIYQVQYDAPPAPEIKPESGTYTITKKTDADGKMSASESNKVQKITLSYPDEYICHYAFDQKPTADSPVYNRPVEMLEGEHIFYAVLEADTGKLGAIASATYVYEEKIVTPTPTPTPRVSYYYGSAATPTPSVTPDPSESGSSATSGGGDGGAANGDGSGGGTDSSSTSGGGDGGAANGDGSGGGTDSSSTSGGGDGGATNGDGSGGTDAGSGGTDTGGGDAGGNSGGGDAGGSTPGDAGA